VKRQRQHLATEIPEKLVRVVLLVAGLLIWNISAFAQKVASPVYNIYRGSTHAHTSYTRSHGEQFIKNPGGGIAVFDDRPGDSIGAWKDGYKKGTGCPAIILIGSSQYPGPAMLVKPDWQKFQGLPSAHFALARANNFDFYITTDHSQEYVFNPPAISNNAWTDTKRAAEEATDKDFVALRGYEHSENNGPSGQGHLNIINSEAYLNALDPRVDLPYLYNWLKTAKSNGEGSVVAVFNHPGPGQYNNWAYRDPEITDIITMLEIINSNDKIHYEAFINSLDKGWKVAPVCGNDNHSLTGITQHTSRTFVLATNKTKAAILDAMKNRRMYASLEQNIQCTYTVNDRIMGSDLPVSNVYKFRININDPDTDNPGDRITKIEIIGDSGRVVKSFSPHSSHSVKWNPTLRNASDKYFFIRIYNESGGDAASADPEKPIAWLAPVWTGK